MSDNSFIVIEGPDGTGKTTQTRLLAEWLQTGENMQVCTCRDPGTTGIGEKVRRWLEAGDSDLTRASRTFLYLVARSQLANRFIQPALDSGSWVVCDRYSMSTAVYQGHLNPPKFSMPLRWGMQLAAGSTRRPDLWIVLTASPREAGKRLRARGEAVSTYYQADVHAAYERETYLMRRRGEKNKVVVVDAEAPEEEVAAHIQLIVTQHFHLPLMSPDRRV